MAKICTEIGMSRIQGFANKDISNELQHIRAGTGSRQGCLRTIKIKFSAKVLLAWFQDRDLNAMRQHAYTAAKLQRMLYQYGPEQWTGAFSHLNALISDHPELIHWNSQYVAPVYDIKAGKRNRRNRVGSPEYHAFQAHLALQGKWELLAERAEYILANPPGKKMLRYQEDQAFYLALARGDIAQMEQVLSNLTGPRAKVRNFDGALGLTEHLMSAFGFIYAKIAWRHGYQVQVDTPYLPMEWLPVSPLPQYNEEFEFTADVDIFEPFAGEYAPLSPVPPGQPMFDITLGSKPEPGR